MTQYPVRLSFLAWPVYGYMNSVSERKMKSKVVKFPPSWCSQICRNSMNQQCVEDCVIKRDCSWFELKPGIRFEDLPSYPINDTKDMTGAEKFTSVVVYLTKLVDHVQGVEDHGREYLYRPSSRKILAALRGKGIQTGTEGTDPTHQDREEREDHREPA